MQKKLSILIVLSMFFALTCGCSLLGQGNLDQEALDGLHQAGSDMSKPHPFDFYLYHDTQAGADQLCDQLSAEGYRTDVREGATDGDWLCLARLTFIPTLENLNEAQSRLNTLTEEYGGEYDGWETTIIP